MSSEPVPIRKKRFAVRRTGGLWGVFDEDVSVPIKVFLDEDLAKKTADIANDINDMSEALNKKLPKED